VEVTRVRTWTIRLPLDAPLHLGAMTIREREYAVVRVDAEGVDAPGAAWSLTRGLPVAAALHPLAAEQALGRRAADAARIWQAARAAGGPAGRSGVAMRALSLLDIALWDVWARAMGVPLHALLGTLRTDIPVMAVSGYPGGGLSPAEAGQRVAQLGAEGHAVVKIARWPDSRDTRTVLEHAAGSARLVVDAAWAWEDAASALAELATWGDVELAWLEDPMPAQRVREYRRLRERCSYQLGIGDEVTDADLLAQLAQDGIADVLRIDAAVAGGITGAQRLLGCCWHAGVPVSLHVGLPIHLHLAAASPACIGVEGFMGDDIALDPVERLIADPPPVTRGRVRVPTGPGLGCSLDWELIERYAVSRTDTNRPA